MKKILIICVSAILLVLAIGLFLNFKNKKPNEPVILDFMYKELDGFDNDGVLQIQIKDSNDALVEQIIVTYLGEDISRVEYVINEQDDEVLNNDKEALEAKDPSEINITDERVLNAIYNNDTQNLNQTFESLTKKNISNYIDILRTNYPEYNLSYTYNY